MALPLILDTDIGGDVDDLLALGVLLGSPEVDLRAVTTVYGDVHTRSRIALKALALRGRARVPVAQGAERALVSERPLLCGPDDGAGFLAPEDLELKPCAEHAADLIARLVVENPRQIHVAGIGALTNIALALLKEDVARQVAGITVMGGVVGGHDRLNLEWVDYNFQCDPEAAKIVLASGAPIRLVPLDITVQTGIYPSDVAALRATGDQFCIALAEQVERYDRYRELGYTYMHDPLAVATLIRPDLVEWTPVHARVETGGEYSAGKLIASAPDANRDANAEIALRVDVSAAHQFIVERLLS
jgi:purine nucleosidase